MALKFKAPKGQRIKTNAWYCGVTNFEGYWWHSKDKLWSKVAKCGSSSHFPRVKSVKAFRRRLRQWSKYLQPGIEFILASRYDLYEVKGKTQPLRG